MGTGKLELNFVGEIESKQMFENVYALKMAVRRTQCAAATYITVVYQTNENGSMDERAPFMLCFCRMFECVWSIDSDRIQKHNRKHKTRN